ncbi:MAG: alanine/ornithine racemase family PLP-dependent enzyme [SAR324 cluster bacterium]|nr:alanine/ornithine racemase family PLP-dependent enzyme [SAR324 cluster bacterium]
MIPRIEISLSKIRENASHLSQIYADKGISLMGVSKAVLGEPKIAKAMVDGSVKYIADSRIENIQKMKAAGITTPFVLLRTALSQAELVVQVADISLNSEMETLKKLSHFAQAQNKIHQIIVMVEMGDLREGVLATNLSAFISEMLSLANLKLVGLGCNLACFGGVEPDAHNMLKLSKLAGEIEKEFSLTLALVSGGNSANYNWVHATSEVGKINNLRIGESILLGCETLSRKPIAGLHLDAFRLVAEVIESKVKPSLPSGTIGQDAFGQIPSFKDQGNFQRVILGLGRQDVDISGLQPEANTTILGASSDHIILKAQNQNMQVGDEVNFQLDYSALLSAMTSPFIKKKFI